MRLSPRQQGATAYATLTGIGVGVAGFVFVLILGILFAQWSVGEFFANLSPSMLGEFAVMVSLAILTLGVPVAAYLRFQLSSPAVILMVIGTCWFLLGLGAPIFAVAAYALWLSPVYVVAYLVLGAVEWFIRR